jgi:hypothetical protein
MQRLIVSDPQATEWHLVLDNLNIHQPEALVRWVAEQEGMDQEMLGVKAKRASCSRWSAGWPSCMTQRIEWSFTTRRNVSPG